MLVRSKFIALLLACLLFGCQSLEPRKPDLLIVIERGRGYYGPAPIYILTIQPDKKVIFEGIEYTKIKGVVESSIDDNQMEQLNTEINKSNFFAFKDDYTQRSENCDPRRTIPEDENVDLYIKLGQSEKRIKHYRSCVPLNEFTRGSLTPLWELENKISEIVGTKQWTGDPSDPFRDRSNK